MEGDNNVEVTTGGGTPATCRWNPTKEQISMLENLYRQGIRTPTAEQIQEITSRLQPYGHIEGKNVFYWFQNHKARQRQKQKQENISYFHHYLHHHQNSPVFPPHVPNVVCGPCYVPQSDLGFYHQYRKVFLPGGIKRKPRGTEKAEKPKPYYDGGGYVPMHPGYNSFISHTENNMNQQQQQKLINGKNQCHQETLDLFPLHPTGFLQERGSTNSPSIASTSTCNIDELQKGSGDQLYFDFFSGNGH